MTAARVVIVLSGALLAWALFFGGGDSSTRLAWIGGGAVLLAGLLTAAALDGRIERPRIDGIAAGCIACFAGLVLWQGISIVWSVQPDRSWDYVNRGLVYLAFLALGAFVGALVPRATRATANGLAVLLGLVIAYALLAKGIPRLYPDYGRLARLRSPVGFWNALALLGDLALVLGLWRAAQRRVDGVLLVYGAVVTVLLAYSRGGVVIALIAVGSWLALDRRRLESLLALVIGGGGAVAIGGIALALHGVSDDNQPHSARVHDGRLFLLAVVLVAVVVGLAGRAALRLELAPAARRRVTGALLVAIGLACLAAMAGAVLRSGGSTSLSAAGTHCTQGARRFACGSSDERLDWWKEAWQLFEDKPLDGTGAGSFELAHRLHRAQFARPVTEPHDFPLQALSETGIVGFLLFVGAVGLAVVRVRRRMGDDAAVALAICALAYFVHIMIDVGYDFVAVSAPFFVLLGVLLVDSKTRAARRERVGAIGVVALAGAAVLSLAAPAVAQHKVDQAVASGDPGLAAQAHRWNPVSVVPLLTEAALEEGRGHDLKALRLYRKAVSTQPQNPDAWVELGEFQLQVMRDACGAYQSFTEAYGLDRFNPVIAVRGGPLDVARAKAKAQGCRL
jgi:O-antigen ligase/polysaccharide polymerase Wzy-like membrane protein